METIFFEKTARGLHTLDRYTSDWQNFTSVERAGGSLDFEPETILDFFNKEFMIYFDTGASKMTNYHKLGRHGKFGQYLYRAWLQQHRGRPPFQRGGFLSKPMRFGGDGIQRLGDLSKYHAQLSAKLETELDTRLQFKMCPSIPEEVAHWRPLPSPKIQTFRQHGYLMRPLFRALYMVLDNQTIPDVISRPVRRENEEYFAWRQRRLVDEISQYSVPLIRTGDEETLSSPISFSSLLDSGLALDVNRPDYQDGVEPMAVRVRLNTAIQFIWDILERERNASKEVDKVHKGLLREQNEYCQLWVYRLIAKCKDFGMDCEQASSVATERALAKVNEEACDSQVEPWWKMMDRWKIQKKL
ncbi:hypothetical protein NW752_010336 [Fusarium irregulare]|uniref:Uncharacterized protein n=1 Tax=Fusarium irregulare TaxID=2494466 RepID=A0A9W8PKI1_9HYPO|nr:hypothetical protein NW752_010336 [Fusarium irregulare]KAJ4007973.1 hypothetical protein NW766_009787 [Fusarium irregulare]